MRFEQHSHLGVFQAAEAPLVFLAAAMSRLLLHNNATLVIDQALQDLGQNGDIAVRDDAKVKEVLLAEAKAGVIHGGASLEGRIV